MQAFFSFLTSFLRNFIYNLLRYQIYFCYNSGFKSEGMPQYFSFS